MMRRLIVPGILCMFASTAQADFDACRDRLEQNARDAGISSDEALQAIASVQKRERIIELDRSQPEFVQTFKAYLDQRVTADNVDRGRELRREHEALLNRVQQEFGIPPAYLVAFWGMETHFGSYFGQVPTLDALATLACDERRSEFFTREFIHALHIVEDGNMRPEEMEGSWAGAMGHMQFMPSTFADHAIDFDGSGRIDIWNSLDDAFGSAGSYLNGIGWRTGERWGREVQLPGNFDYRDARLDERRSISEWADHGVRTATGEPLPTAEMQASILVPSGHQGPAFMVYDNFRVIMRWNYSISYALAVGHLADRIAGMGTLEADWDEDPLTLDEVEEIQKLLNALGHDSGEPDGRPGPQTRGAIRRFQEATGAVADGHPNQDLLRALREASDDT